MTDDAAVHEVVEFLRNEAGGNTEGAEDCLRYAATVAALAKSNADLRAKAEKVRAAYGAGGSCWRNPC